MMRRLKTILIALAALLAPAAAMAQPVKLNPPPGPWTAPNVAVTFPEKIGEYQRISVTEFNAKNHGVGYILERNGERLNTITVFVYVLPDRPTCKEEFEASAASIVRANPTAKRLVTDAAASPRGTPRAALHASFAFSGAYAADQNVPLTSDLYVYCKPGSEWIVKARTSWPANTDMSREAAMILRSINWSSEVTD